MWSDLPILEVRRTVLKYVWMSKVWHCSLTSVRPLILLVLPLNLLYCIVVSGMREKPQHTSTKWHETDFEMGGEPLMKAFFGRHKQEPQRILCIVQTLNTKVEDLVSVPRGDSICSLCV